MEGLLSTGPTPSSFYIDLKLKLWLLCAVLGALVLTGRGDTVSTALQEHTINRQKKHIFDQIRVCKCHRLTVVRRRKSLLSLGIFW